MSQSSPPESSLEQEFWERRFDDTAQPRRHAESRALPPRPAFDVGGRDTPFTRVVERIHEWRDDTRFGVVVLVLIAVIAGVVWYRIGISGGDDAAAAPNAASAPAGTTAPSPGTGASGTTRGPAGGARIVVHVAGAVVHAGVVELAANARVIDAIKAVGGAQDDGDLDRLNLAAKLTDGERVYVAKIGQADPGVLGASTTGGGSAATAGSPGATINLNTATQAQLETLPGIGPTYAQAIIAERQARGGFKAVNELRNVRGIGEKRFAELAPLVTV